MKGWGGRSNIPGLAAGPRIITLRKAKFFHRFLSRFTPFLGRLLCPSPSGNRAHQELIQPFWVGWKTKGKRGVGASEIFSHKFSIEFHYERTNEHKRTQTLCVRAIPRGFPRDRDHMESDESRSTGTGRKEGRNGCWVPRWKIPLQFRSVMLNGSRGEERKESSIAGASLSIGQLIIAELGESLLH